MKYLKNRIINRLTQPFTRKHYSKTYSQCGEDVIMDFIFKAKGVKRLSYLDIGAYRPFEINNTAYFYKKGSLGVNIEPNPKGFREFIKIRPKDINLNIGIGKKEETKKYFIFDSETLNTFNESEANQYQSMGHKLVKILNIKTEPINQILDKYFSHGLDLLSIDVEGLEMEIFSSLDFKNKSPRVICSETISYSKSLGKGIKNQEILEFLKNKNYLIYADTYINTIFVKKEFLES
jgi:FkbM family methyltransferase